MLRAANRIIMLSRTLYIHVFELERNPTVKRHYDSLSWQQKRQFWEQEEIPERQEVSREVIQVDVTFPVAFSANDVLPQALLQHAQQYPPLRSQSLLDSPVSQAR